MEENKGPSGLQSEAPPDMPTDKKAKWSKPFKWLFGIVGVIASTSTVVALVYEWVEPDTSKQDQIQKLEDIDRKLTADQEDSHLVNQVSRRVNVIRDEYKRIQTKLTDIRSLDASLSAAPKAAILLPEQQQERQASRAKQRKVLMGLLDETGKLAHAFVASVEQDETLSKVKSEGSQVAQRRAKALEQATQIRELLPELDALRQKYAD